MINSKNKASVTIEKFKNSSVLEIGCGPISEINYQFCKENNIPIYEKDFSIEDVHTSDEAFVTGTFAGIIPAVNIDDYKISNGLKGKLTHTLQEYYSDKLIKLYPKT